MKKLSLLMIVLLAAMNLSAQNIRYVSKNGKYANDGMSWATAKNNIQDAINDLVNNNLTGEVWVAEGTYYPTETTMSTSSPYYKAFKIPAGITVRGGFRGAVKSGEVSPTTGKAAVADYPGETALNQRKLKDDNNFGNGDSEGGLDPNPSEGTLDGEAARSGRYVYETILCGDLNPEKIATLTFNDDKHQFDIAFYGNSYHVVWFAMNGFDGEGRALPLGKPAKLEGCIVEGGHAFNNDLSEAHPHVAYGGGIYMVANSFVYNCEVRNCDASRNGGGIYMDGGGIVRRTYVHKCQALGIGTDYGMGGGICEEGSVRNSKANPIVVAQSVVSNCVGRLGGGVGINAEKMLTANKYTAVINSTVVNNNTATVEAGGVYTLKGGGVASSTIVNNECTGSGVMLGGAITGRSGGLYSRDAAYVGNTVIWGNKCNANSDTQYASSREHSTNNEKSRFYYNALSKSDNTDWSLTEKMGVLSLADENNTTGDAVNGIGFPLFFHPTTTQGCYKTQAEESAGATADWQVSSESFLSYAGISTVDLDYEGLTPAPAGRSYDMRFAEFNSRPSIGAICSQKADIEPAANVTYNGVKYDKAFFVDPCYIYSEDNPGHNGGSWTKPARFLGIILDYIAEQNYSGEKVAVFVKEGIVDNTRIHGTSRVRETPLDIPSNVTIIGSFSGELTGTQLTSRNPVQTPTVISAELMNNYKFNIAHLITIDGKQNITIDGFKLTLANASSTELNNTDKDGAAITLKDCEKDGENITIHFRNIIVSNSTADHGAAVYADNAAADFENCIFHNNATSTINNSGVIYATNGSTLKFDHSDVLRNVGYASYLGTAKSSTPTTNYWTNSIFYGNMSRSLNDTNVDKDNVDPGNAGLNKYALAAFNGNTAGATGSRCMFDARSAQFSTQFNNNDTGNKWQYDLQYAFVEGTGQGYPRFINPTKNAGVTEDGDQTYYGRSTSFEPHNNNPIVNMAKATGTHDQWGTDIIGTTRDFGGLPDLGAVENHVATVVEGGENAYKDGQQPYGTILYVRDYNTYNADGTVKTTDTETTGRDGSSWQHAINGNANYTLSGIRNVEDTTPQTVYKGYRIKSGTNQLIVKGASLTRTTNSAPGTVFMLCDENGDELGESAAITDAKRLKDIFTGQYLYLDYSSGNYYFRTSANPDAAQATATIVADRTNYKLQYTASNGQKRYIRNNGTIPSTTATAWTFEKINVIEEVGLGTYTPTPYDYGTLNGLQYAVSKQNIEYTDDPVRRSNPEKAKKQVWVGAGIYSKDPGAGDHSCFIIKDGVDVYGAFPKDGNPAMDQRQALVSQYVKVLNGKDPADFETIIQPITKTVTTGVVRRVLGQPVANNPRTWNGNELQKDNYDGATWDGFTIRFGCNEARARNTWGGRDGGGGAAIYNNVKLVNCVVTNNYSVYNGGVYNGQPAPSDQENLRAGGVYMDGGTMASCYIINNTVCGMNGTTLTQVSAAYGGGAYMYNGTMYNCVVANNRAYAKYADGAGLYFENATFFNNTIVNNKAEGSSSSIGGIALYTDLDKVEGDQSLLNIYNSIILNNTGFTGANGGQVNVAMRTNSGKMYLHNCITSALTEMNEEKKVISYDAACQALANDQINTLLENCPISGYVDPSAGSGTFETWNLRLRSDANTAINKGYGNPTLYGVTYDLSEYNDMDFADRIQDCAIDIGAYEFNGAYAITPDESSVSGQAIFYVTPEGYGTASGTDPENAACAAKLQKVIDAAGRYKYLNSDKQVIVKVANSYDMYNGVIKQNQQNAATNAATGKNPGDVGYIDLDDPSNFTYYATRTTDWTDQDVRIWSIIVPRGVEVWGGYTDKNSDGSAWSDSKNGFYTKNAGVVTDNRNITANPTYFDSYYVNKQEKTNANTYHVVSFTDRIFDKNGYAYTKEDFKDKTAEQIRTILSTGASSTYIDIIGNEETLFAHMSDPLDGFAGVSGDVIMDGEDPKNFGTNENPVYASNRAVLDGIFVSGGKANAPSNSSNSTLNVNSYGGGALVNDYAYVRNCILTGNTAVNGGALALTHGALVSGSLILENNAKNQGGGLYFFEDGAVLSNGVTVNTTASSGKTMDQRMAHVLTSTIVSNNAAQGGGVWFNNSDPNARIISSVIWANNASDQKNVYGLINPEQPTEDETDSESFYPFSYSAIESQRASGTNNMSTLSDNSQGVRFVDMDYDFGAASPNLNKAAADAPGAAKYARLGYYGLTHYSILCSAGMPVSKYEQLRPAIAISDVDILGRPRVVDGVKFVEVGARALAKQLPNKQLMLRLFVSHPEDVDTEKAVKFMELTGAPGTAAEYYSQEGSSFAYPFNTLQDALDYVKDARDGKIITNQDGVNSNVQKYDAQNLPFEILVGKGTHYPRKDLNGDTKSVWAHTFAIPEGVTIIGGFDPKGGSGTYYGRYYKKANKNLASGETVNIYTNVVPIPTGTQSGANEIGRGNKSADEIVNVGGEDITFQQWHIQDIADRRAMEDNNKNGIIEPWEFKYPTTISGNAVNGETDGVYHIMTAVADEDAVGRLPKVQSKKNNGTEFTGYAKAITGDPSEETGYQSMEEGQQIRLNGLIITGGNALTYLSTALDEYGKYIFYQGAGLQVDGNRYKNTANGGPSGPAVFHNSAAYGVGYRDIPVSITNCQFRNNIAGYGGAISTNGSLSLFGSSFEQNLAIAQTEKPEAGETWTTDVDPLRPGQTVSKVMYPGQGGAILATHQLSAFNTLFANNEARLGDDESQNIDLEFHPTFRVPDEKKASATLRAAGGAIMMGSAGVHHIVNCNFVRNKANAYPAVFTMNPTPVQDDNVDTHKYSQIINTVAWGNEVNPDMLAQNLGNKSYQFASKLLVNVGKKNRSTSYIKSKVDRVFYNPKFDDEHPNTPISQDDLEKVDSENPGNEWQEAVWFCAYEEGTGFTPHNENDLRDAIVYSVGKFAPWMIKQANGGSYQNCNILITADNKDVAGPNFGYPSAKAGYDGFMEGADWSPSRYNALTDNGNGWIRQSVDAGTLAVTFHDKEGYNSSIPIPDTDPTEYEKNYQGAYSYTHYISDIVPGEFPEYKLWIALGNEKYMQATNDKEEVEQYINNTNIGRPNRNLPRISPDPTLGVEKAYIDIGMYEYYKQPLLKPGSEVDILWVSTKEKPENGPANGATWKTPTSDLQRAIEALLSSRNGHKKEIRIMEGEYTPVKTHTISGQKYNAFVVDNLEMNKTAIVPSSWDSDAKKNKYYAQSLTIKGGYSADIMYEYDPAQYKTVIRQKDAPVGTSTDHLFYVNDPIVRYYYNSDADYSSHDNGATLSGDPGEQSNDVRTMPIQIDGLTLINDKVQTAGTQGSAIYYPEVATTASHTVSVNGEVTYYTDKNRNQISNKETEYFTTKIYYTSEANKTSDTRQAKNLPTEFFKESGDEKENPDKLVITKSQIIGSGKAGDTESGASAVFIGANGGRALIYNTVFHSNQGMPLDAVNTVSINNTFAKNLGQVKLTGDDSEMHNSVMWMNNNGGTQTNMTTGNRFTYNSYTGGSSTEDVTYHNIGLVAQNGNIAEGPNFVNTEGTVEELNFDIKPSARLLNKGMDDSLEAKGNPDENHGKYYELVVKPHYDYALVSTTLKDVLFRNRLNSNNIDRGAYEFQGTLSNILYVDPNKSHSDAAQGLHWDDAFGYGDLQNAVDLASLSIGVSTPKSYVFVKGASATNKGLNTNETLTLRDGVSVYGSVLSNYTDNHDMKKGGTGADKDYYKYGNATEYNIDAFISDLLEKREGVASSAASKTTVTGIKTAKETVYTNNVTLADGFVVTDPGTPTQPVVDITNGSQNALIALRNIIVTGNDLSTADAGTNVAQLTNGLLYEALIYGNKQASNNSYALKVGNAKYTAPENYTTNGYAVSVTVEGDVSANDRTDIVDADNPNIYNSIINSIQNTDNDAAFGYISNRHISGYYYNIDDAALNYQLTEKSKYIDQCNATVNPMTGDAAKYASFINYDTDRDLLGNPRLLSGLTEGNSGKFLDRGAFETWRVDNDFICGNNGNIKSINTAPKYADINKQFYPHDGSVVYIMENKSLVIDPVDAVNEIKPTPHNPGFMLLKKGASCYGNGRPMTCAYLAVERSAKAEGNVISMPFAMNYNRDVTVPTYTDGVLTLEKDNGSAYNYNSNARADWQYNFHNTSSPCWTEATAVVPANNGVLYVPAGNRSTLRFTARGINLKDYIYTESSNDALGKQNVYKTVTLTQYNAGGRTAAVPEGSPEGVNANTGDNTDFTDNADMGWNAIGLPYLVSDYKPYEQVDPSNASNLLTPNPNDPYRMNLPHTLWMYFDGTAYADGTTMTPGHDGAGDGGFYSVSSWDKSDAVTDAELIDGAHTNPWHVSKLNGQSIWVGEGFFTQTATLEPTETLTFYRPIAPASFAGGSGVKAERWYMTDEIRQLQSDNDDHYIVATRYYTPDGILQAKPVKGVTIQVDIYNDGTQKSHKYMKR